jgi:hypothetical protein
MDPLTAGLKFRANRDIARDPSEKIALPIIVFGSGDAARSRKGKQDAS